MHIQNAGRGLHIRETYAGDDAVVFGLLRSLAVEVGIPADRAAELVCKLIDGVSADRTITYLAERGNEPVGLVRGLLVPLPPSRRLLSGPGGYIDECYVVPSERGSGVGKELIRAVLSGFKRQGVVYVSTHPRTPHVEALCRLFGAREVTHFELG